MDSKETAGQVIKLSGCDPYIQYTKIILYNIQAAQPADEMASTATHMPVHK